MSWQALVHVRGSHQSRGAYFTCVYSTSQINCKLDAKYTHIETKKREGRFFFKVFRNYESTDSPDATEATASALDCVIGTKEVTVSALLAPNRIPRARPNCTRHRQAQMVQLTVDRTDGAAAAVRPGATAVSAARSSTRPAPAHADCFFAISVQGQMTGTSA